IYIISAKLTKRDKLGLHTTVEDTCIEMLSLSIEAAFKSKLQKKTVLEFLRVRTEVLKHLVRTENEIHILDLKTYLRLSEQIVEISKMINGWITYITQKESL
ncbi:MAG: four helix bundle protein, partial [Candidatus Pacebacteria bacterium]|nr:four helix bundle protein [Candidatus Paceibacterota bacterium]